MTKLLEQALRQIEQLPDGEQDAAAGALLDYMKHRRDIELTQEQVVEVRRRVADADRKLISPDEARARISRFGPSSKS
jgi:phytoene/squalene synthetase